MSVKEALEEGKKQLEIIANGGAPPAPPPDVIAPPDG